MAGLYADIPGTRFALDQDGTVAKYRDQTAGSAWVDVTGSLAETQKANTSTYLQAGYIGWSTTQYSFAFPEARSIAGMYIHPGFDNAGYTASITSTQYSTDTTDGTDGTWSNFSLTFTSFASHANAGQNTRPYYRSDIASLSLSNVKGIRLAFNNGNATPRLFVLHVYGSRPMSGVDRLAYWHPSSDLALTAAYLDYGDVPQGTSIVRQLRIKNLSGSLTANSISVAASDLASEYTSGELQVSTDGTTYASSVNIGNLAPGVIGSVLYVRLTVPGAESPSQRNARLLASASSWT